MGKLINGKNALEIVLMEAVTKYSFKDAQLEQMSKDSASCKSPECTNKQCFLVRLRAKNAKTPILRLHVNRVTGETTLLNKDEDYIKE